MRVLQSPRHLKLRGRLARVLIIGLIVILAVTLPTTDVTRQEGGADAKQTGFPVRVTITALDTQCELKREEVPSGLMELVLENHSSQQRAVQLVQTDDTGESRYTGGVAGLQPGASQAVVVPVNPGQITAICFDSQNGTEFPHVEITVSATAEAGTQAMLNSDQQSTIELGPNCSYSLPSPVRRQSMWTIRNQSDEVQDLRILAVPLGATPSEIASLFADTGSVPPGMEAGGMALLSPKEEASIRVGLAQGEYLAWCSTYFDREETIELAAVQPAPGDAASEEILPRPAFAPDDSSVLTGPEGNPVLLPSISEPGVSAADEMAALPGVGTVLQPFSVIEND